MEEINIDKMENNGFKNCQISDSSFLIFGILFPNQFIIQKQIYKDKKGVFIMKRIFCIMGKSASGKDTIYNLIKNQFKNLSPVVIYTTRPMRDGEKNGITYHFISMEEMNRLEKDGKLIERRNYDTVNGLWSYATGVDCFKEEKNYLIITTPAAYGQMREKINDAILIPIYIEVRDDIRLTRAITREKENEQGNYEEICRRFLADARDFREEILEKLEITNRFNNNGNCFVKVKSFVEEKLMEK